MTKNFLGENTLKSQALFEERKEYQNDAFQKTAISYTINMWENNKYNYGKINQFNEPVFISESNLKEIRSDKEVILVADFVADAFDDLKKYVTRALAQRKIENDEIIAKMEPKRAWTSTPQLHHNYMEFLYESIIFSHFVSNKKDTKVKSFVLFVQEMLNALKIVATSFPFTRSGFILSKYCNPLTSGLMVEIATENPSIDQVKQTKFLDHPNFSFYKNAARRFGFRIDSNVPWRLIAHVSSRQMQEYMLQYGIEAQPGNAGNLFDIYYYKAQKHDVEIMKSYLIQMYNSFVASHPYFKQSIMNEDGTTKRIKSIKRKPATEESLNEILPPEYWLKTYATMKFVEGKKNTESKEIAFKIKRAITIANSFDMEAAIRYTITEASK